MVLLVAGVGPAMSGPARACSIVLGPPVLRGTPADGAVDVPTDVVPVYDVIAAQMAGSSQFFLTDDAGQTTAVTPKQSFIWSFELFPAVPLRPLTRYTLHGSWPATTSVPGQTELSLSFTTGPGASTDVPVAPTASLAHYQVTSMMVNSCSPPHTGSCVAIPQDTLTRVSYIDSFGQEVASRAGDGTFLPYLMTGPFFTDLSGINQGTNFECIKLQTRVANGTFSDDATILCGRDAPTFQLTGSDAVACTPAGITQEGKLVVAIPGPHTIDDSPLNIGCSVADDRSQPPRPAAVWWLALATTGLALHRRRRSPIRS
jgi:MYXO-CTERM domain-containing protein